MSCTDAITTKLTKRISKQNFNVAFLIPHECLKPEWLI